MCNKIQQYMLWKKEEKDKGEEEAFTELEKNKKICLEIEEVEKKIARTAKRRRTKHTGNCQKRGRKNEKMNPRNRERKKYKELNRMCFEDQELLNTASEAVNEAKTVFDK